MSLPISRSQLDRLGERLVTQIDQVERIWVVSRGVELDLLDHTPDDDEDDEYQALLADQRETRGRSSY
jgi:hypothetical protein